MPSIGHAGNGGARSRWSLWRAALSSGRDKISLRAHIGAEVTSPEGWRYTLLAESRKGYQNLCRLITRMKLRAKKDEGHVSEEEIAELHAGLICLTGGEEGPLAYAFRIRGTGDRKRQCMRRLSELFGREKFMSNCSGISRARKKRATRPQWKSLAN